MTPALRERARAHLILNKRRNLRHKMEKLTTFKTGCPDFSLPLYLAYSIFDTRHSFPCIFRPSASLALQIAPSAFSSVLCAIFRAILDTVIVLPFMSMMLETVRLPCIWMLATPITLQNSSTTAIHSFVEVLQHMHCFLIMHRSTSSHYFLFYTARESATIERAYHVDDLRKGTVAGVNECVTF